MTYQKLVEVHLRGVPVNMWIRASAHQEAIQRELEIMRASQPKESVPNRLMALIDDLDARFGGAGDQVWEELRAAAEHGKVSADVTFHLPPEAGLAARQLSSMLAEMDQFCREGDHLLTLATPSDLVEVREWILAEFTRQIDLGEDPLSWLQYRGDADRPPDPADRPSLAGQGTEHISFDGSLDLATVGELRDLIQEKRARNPREIVVDLSGIGFIDSVGIGLLVTTHQRLEEEGVSLRLMVPPRLKELLRLTGLLEVLQPDDSPVV